MRRPASPGAVALLAVALAMPVWAAQAPAPAREPPPGWRVMQPDAGRFKVAMPANPETGKRTIKTDLGPVHATRYTVTDGANVTYDVLFNVYPKAIVKTNPSKLLDGARDSLIYQINGRLLSDEPHTRSGFPARDIEIVTGSGSHYRARLVWVENRLYQLMTVTHGKPRPEASAFFDSFELTGRR